MATYSTTPQDYPTQMPTPSTRPLATSPCPFGSGYPFSAPKCHRSIACPRPVLGRRSRARVGELGAGEAEISGIVGLPIDEVSFEIVWNERRRRYPVLPLLDIRMRVVLRGVGMDTYHILLPNLQHMSLRIKRIIPLKHILQRRLAQLHHNRTVIN